MTVTEIINNILAGGLLGVIGQGIRIAVGLKKFNEDNAIQVARDEPAEEFGDKYFYWIRCGRTWCAYQTTG
jgi:hypothetical protein